MKETSQDDKHPDIANLRDLGDFCVHWKSFRKHMSDEAIERDIDSTETATIVKWLCRLADKVASRDTP